MVNTAAAQAVCISLYPPYAAGGGTATRMVSAPRGPRWLVPSAPTLGERQRVAGWLTCGRVRALCFPLYDGLVGAIDRWCHNIFGGHGTAHTSPGHLGSPPCPHAAPRGPRVLPVAGLPYGCEYHRNSYQRPSI